MLSRTPTAVGPDIATSGPVSLAQGVYGARGNLELVACDAADGLWVFWFNADLDTDPLETPDVPPRRWSAGLRFAGGHRFVDALIVQSTLGPDHLEVLALDEHGVLQSWYWSPGPGFQRRVTDAATAVVRFAAAHDGGTLRLTVEDSAESVIHVVSPPRGYPARGWFPAASGPALDDGASSVQAIVAAGVPAEDIQPGTARSAVSTCGGGTLELTWRDAAGSIRHLGVPQH
ncbi:hypothetical protein ACFVSU_06575 [Microbacterium sp. NPDC058062]|uniref:hypothetical protein n=1 Tax=Microbacterium sp. NPDC058062 TaxID=3346320 RepID=UPI0036D885CC